MCADVHASVVRGLAPSRSLSVISFQTSLSMSFHGLICLFQELNESMALAGWADMDTSLNYLLLFNYLGMVSFSSLNIFAIANLSLYIVSPTWYRLP